MGPLTLILADQALDLMVHSHCTRTGTGTGQGPGMGSVGTTILCITLHTGLGRGPGPILSYCASTHPCTAPGPGTVLCEKAINVRIKLRVNEAWYAFTHRADTATAQTFPPTATRSAVASHKLTVLEVTLKLIRPQQTRSKKPAEGSIRSTRTGSYADQLMQRLPGAMTILRAQFPW